MIRLDEEQESIVGYEGSQVVIAGPGSGKTRVLTEKARQLFSKGEDILCLTFTRGAAKEIRERVPGLPATTIHSYCCGEVGWKDDWSFTGLLYRYLKDEYKRRFNWILLDECQDMNQLELDVSLSLMGDKAFIVGDPYQSIYGFQGALGARVVTIFDGLGFKVSRLHNNYRSCETIVDKLNKWYDRQLVSKDVRETGLTCVLFRRNDDLFYVSKILKGEGIAHRVRLSAEQNSDREYDVVEESSLRLMTIHQSKGLEFDKVLLFSWYPQGSGEEKRIYYVAVARASKEFREVRGIKELLFLLS